MTTSLDLGGGESGMADGPVLAFFLGALVAAAPAGAAPEDGETFFEETIRPILVDRCYECHSAGAERLRGGLRLDTAEGVRLGGESGPALAAADDDPLGSRLVRAISYEDADLRMPPRGRLPENEIAALTEWVRLGAPDPRRGEASGTPPTPRTIDVEAGRRHFAFRPLSRPAPPNTGGLAAFENPIDRFVARALADRGLTFNPPADRRTLARRLAFDLVGLPPGAEEIDAFAADERSGAVGRYADALLSSPRFGERQARHWLDLARFAESHGFEHDYDRPNAWPYRDFVVRALNDDLPYDTFVSWQIAGDEIAPESPLAMAATGFLAAGVHSTQITRNQVEKERYDELDDMLKTTGTAMLGLTIGCARCHDHKFDPIGAIDYYRMLAAFTTTVRSDVPIEIDPEGDARAAAEWRAELDRLEAERAAFDEGDFEARFQEFLRDESDASERGASASAPEWIVLDVISATSHGGASFERFRDGALAVSGKNPDSDTHTLVAVTARRPIRSIRLEALADESLVAGGPGRADNGNFALSNVRVTAGPLDASSPAVAVALANPEATFEQTNLPAAAAIDDDPLSGWAVDPRFGEDHAIAFETPGDVGFAGGTVLTVTLEYRTNVRHAIARPRLSVSSADRRAPLRSRSARQSEVEARSVLDATRDLREEQEDALRRYYRAIDPEWRRLDDAVAEHRARKPKKTLRTVLVASEGLAAVRLHTQGEDFLPVTHFLVRGDPDQKREIVEPGFLRVLSTAKDERWKREPPPAARTSFRRLSLASWLTDVENGAGALLARVAVNRAWQRHFGRGIVPTSSDFGLAGDPPTHPDLLEWLACELIENGWRMKPIHRLIVTSAAYAQSARADDDRRRIDPDNALFSRFPRRRLEAEAIRDAMLFVSGELDETPGGPGTLDPRHRRRSLYFTVKRSRLVPMMTLFDAPDALQGIDRRSVTSVAPQALLFMNDPFVRELATAFSSRVSNESPAGTAALVRASYRRALGRSPDADELALGFAFLQEQSRSYAARGAEDESLADLAQSLFSLNEFIHVD